jgi:chromosome segregation ATPase
MIGSRGVTPPDVVAGLGVLADLLKNIDPTLLGRLEELKAEEYRVATNGQALASAEAEHRERTRILEQRKGELDQREAGLVERERACEASVTEVARRQASFNDQARELREREAALAAEREKLAQSAREFTEGCSAKRTELASEIQAAKDEIARQRQQAATAVQEDEATHAANIRRMHEVAEGEIARQQRELVQREAQLGERERAINERAAQLRAVLGA